MDQVAPAKMRWSLIFALIAVVLWSQPGISAKIEHFTDKEGTLHISNESQAEPGKPGVQAPAPIETPPPQTSPPITPPAPVPPPQIQPPPTEPPETSGKEAEPPAEAPVPESDGEAQPAPAVPPAKIPPGQQQ